MALSRSTHMPLSSAFSTFKAATAPENKDAIVAERFASWEQSVTIDDIRKAFLVSLTEGDEDLYVDITAEELERFYAGCSAFQTGSEGQLETSLLVQHLVQTHKEKTEVLQLIKQNLENLVKSLSLGDTSHSRCESNFKQAVGIGKHHVIRTRTPSACLQFIFSSLAHPPTGTPTHNDVLDILCRVRYPTRTAAKGQLRCKPVEQLSSLVERLEPTTQRSLTETLSASTMQELGLSVEAFPSPYRRLVTEPNMQIGGGVNAEQFEEWALQVRFLDTLNQVFEVLFTKCQY